MNIFDRDVRRRAEKEVFTVRPETEQKLKRALLSARLEQPRVRRSLNLGWALGLALALVLCVAALALTGQPAKDDTTYPLSEGLEETPLIVTPAPEPVVGASLSTEWELRLQEGQIQFITTVTCDEAQPIYLTWKAIPDPLMESAVLVEAPDGIYLPAGSEAVEDQALYYYAKSTLPDDPVFSIRWNVYQLEVPVHQEEAWAQSEEERAAQEERLESAIIDGQIAVVGDQLALSRSFQEAYQQSPLDYYIDHGMISLAFQSSARKTVNSLSYRYQPEDLARMEPMAQYAMEGFTARYLQIDRLDSAPCVLLDLQFDSPELAMDYLSGNGEYTFFLKKADKSPFENVMDSTLTSCTIGRDWLEGETRHVYYLFQSDIQLTEEERKGDLVLVPFRRSLNRYLWEEAIPFPNL